MNDPFKERILKQCYKEVDGYYVFAQNQSNSGSFYEAHDLRTVADILDELNAPWHKQVCKALEECLKKDPL